MAASEARPSEPAEMEALGAWAGTRLGLRCLAIEPLPAGIGRRRFYRLRFAGTPASAIARVDAPEDPAGRPAGAAPEPPLEPIRALLEGHGLPVPRRFAADLERGVELLEDFGDESLCAAVARADRADAEALVACALDLVPRLQRVPGDASGVEAFSRTLDRALFRYKAELFVSVSLASALGRAPSPAERGAVVEAFDFVANLCADAPRRLSHRDFQSQNLMLRAPLGSPEPLAMIDLQGAFLAPPEYDLVCLLRDSYLVLDERFVDAQRERLRPLLPDAPAPADYALRFELLTLTRKGKDHARFLTALARGDERYRDAAARTVTMLRRAAERTSGVAPALGRLAELVLALPEATPCAR